MSDITPTPRIAASAGEDARLKRYLLDQLGSEERSEVERAYFEDDEKFGALMAVEDDLVDGYVHDRMPPDERLVFERTFLATAAGRERVRRARILDGAVARLDANRHDVPARTTGVRLSRLLPRGIGAQRAAAAALVLSLAAGAWSLFEIVRLRGAIAGFDTARATLQRDAEAARERAAREQARADRNELELERLQSGAPPRNLTGFLVTLSLLPVALRSAGESSEVAIGPGTKVVELELAVDPGQKLESLRVALEEDGRPIGHLETSKVPPPGPGVILVPLPTYMLAPGRSYAVTLERLSPGGAPEAIHRYEFRVAAR